jgi:hypothetical protein
MYEEGRVISSMPNTNSFACSALFFGKESKGKGINKQTIDWANKVPLLLYLGYLGGISISMEDNRGIHHSGDTKTGYKEGT